MSASCTLSYELSDAMRFVRTGSPRPPPSERASNDANGRGMAEVRLSHGLFLGRG